MTEAVALLRDVPAEDVRGAVVHGREEPAPALRLRPEPRRVRAPELVRPLGRDPAAVGPVSAGMAPPHRHQQTVLPHQPQHPVLADPDPLGRKPRLHLPVALAEERTRLQHRPDLPAEAPRRSVPSSGLASRAVGDRTSVARPVALAAHTRSSVRPARSRTPSSAGTTGSSPDSPGQAPQELPQLVPVPPFF